MYKRQSIKYFIVGAALLQLGTFAAIMALTLQQEAFIASQTKPHSLTQTTDECYVHYQYSPVEVHEWTGKKHKS